MLFPKMLAMVWGGGDLATGVGYRLVKSGFPVIVLELHQPLVIRREVSFAEAIYRDSIEIDGVKAQVGSTEKARELARSGIVAVLADPNGTSIGELEPDILIDCRMLKHNPGDVTRDRAPLVIAIGPGFKAGIDCHAVVETNRGHDLGRVIWSGTAEPDTGIPGRVGTHQADRVLRAPADGTISSIAKIGDLVKEGQLLATVGNKSLVAPFDGVLRGLAHDGVSVPRGKKIGDVDPRGIRRHSFTISEKALAVGGGVVEAIFSSERIQSRIKSSFSEL